MPKKKQTPPIRPVNNGFKYDVAFSFRAEDESLALELSDRLEGRFKTFVYSKKQESLAGTDGQETFPAVFGAEARCVVVLYREGWGQTAWTKIEETSVKNRAMGMASLPAGWEFLLFIKLEPESKILAWVPRSHIYFDFRRFGLDGAAAVISNLIQREGGVPVHETLEQKAARISRVRASETRRQMFRGSEEGVQAARNKVSQIFDLLGTRCKDIFEDASLQIIASHTQWERGVKGTKISLRLRWHCSYANSLSGAQLEVTYWRGPPMMFGMNFFGEKPQQICRDVYEFDITPSSSYVWAPKNEPTQRKFSSTELTDHVLGELLERDQEELKRSASR